MSVYLDLLLAKTSWKIIRGSQHTNSILYFKKARLRENVNDSFKNSKLVTDRDLDKNTSHMVHFNKGIV